MGGDTYSPITVFGILMNNDQIQDWSESLFNEFENDIIESYYEEDSDDDSEEDSDDDSEDDREAEAKEKAREKAREKAKHLTPTMILRIAPFSKEGITTYVLLDEAESRWEGQSVEDYEMYYNSRCIVGVQVENGTSATALIAQEEAIATKIAEYTPIKGGSLRLYTGIIS